MTVVKASVHRPGGSREPSHDSRERVTFKSSAGVASIQSAVDAIPPRRPTHAVAGSVSGSGTRLGGDGVSSGPRSFGRRPPHSTLFLFASLPRRLERTGLVANLLMRDRYDGIPFDCTLIYVRWMSTRGKVFRSTFELLFGARVWF